MTNRDAIERQLSLVDSTAIIVGIIIGAGFYGMSPDIASLAGGPGRTLLAWLAGGVMALAGAMCYAELATAYPRQGGEYVYITEAWGRFAGFQYAWAGFWIIRPASIGAMAMVFGTYAQELVPGGRFGPMAYAMGLTVLLTALNILGVQTGKWTQNLLTLVKVAALLAVFAVGFAMIGKAAPRPTTPPGFQSFAVALILVMWTYGGWNEMPSVAAEVRRPEKNLLRALVLGTTATMAIYIAGTLAFFAALGYQGTAGSKAVAADVMRLAAGSAGQRLVSTLVAVSCMGAVNGLIFTGARVYYALGTEHRMYRWLGVWNPITQTPLRALLVQSLVGLAVIALVGRSQGGFVRLANFTGPLFWLFLLLTGMALFRLRYKDAGREASYRVPFYPVLPAVFCASCAGMLYASLNYAVGHYAIDAWITTGVVVGGVLAWLATNRPSAGSSGQSAFAGRNRRPGW
ncbi:MAG: amino acid permease [Tepidisphaeraceae bacterium]|jgi:amino acid transporter